VDLAINTGYWEVDYSWTDSNQDKYAQTSELGRIRYIDIGQAVKIDPSLKSPYTIEAVVGAERKLARNIGLSLNFIYRENRRFWWTKNLLWDVNRDYTPLTVQDPGPDGIYGRADDGGLITIYNLDINKVGVTDPYVKERPGYRTSYKGVEFVFNKRYADRWQLMASVTLGKTNVKLPSKPWRNLPTGNSTIMPWKNSGTAVCPTSRFST